MIKRFIITLIVFILTMTGGGISAGTEAATPTLEGVSVAEDKTDEETKAEIIGSTSFSGNEFIIDGELQTVADYYGIEDSFVLDMYDRGYTNIQVYDSGDMTEDLLLNRVDNRAVIVERIIGIVENEDGDGKILNAGGDFGDYITYKNKGIDDTTPGTVILTFCIYNPYTTYTDDIIERTDFVLDKSFQK